MSHVSEAGAFESVASGPAGPLPLAIGVVLGGALLTAVYGYAPPFVVNQHAYFLHGLANAGVGHLAHDTLAQTADGWPVFSLLVEFIYRTAGDGLVLAVHVLLNGTYIVGV